MSRKGHQQRKDRGLKMKDARNVIEELVRQREAARRSMPDIFKQLNVLFETSTTRAIRIAS